MKCITATRTHSAAPSRNHQTAPKPKAEAPAHKAGDSVHLSGEAHSPVTETAHRLDGTFQAGDLMERMKEGFHEIFGGKHVAPHPAAKPTGPVGTQPGKPGGLAGTLKPQGFATAPKPAAAPPRLPLDPQAGGLAGTLKAERSDLSLLKRPATLKGASAPAEPSPTSFGKGMGVLQAGGGALTALHESAEVKRAAAHHDGQGALNHTLGAGSGLANATAGVATVMGSTAVAGPACALGAGLDGYKDLHEGFTKGDSDKMWTGGAKTAGALAMAGAPMAGPAAPLVFLGGAATYGAAWANSSDGRAAIGGGVKAAGEFCKDPGAALQKLGAGLQDDAQTLLDLKH